MPPAAPQEWLPDLDAVVEAQFDSVNKKKEWYKGIVKAINHDDSMTVLFASNVSERNIHPDKVRLVGGKPPKIKSRYPSTPADGAAGFKVGDAVQAPFEGNVKKLHEGSPPPRTHPHHPPPALAPEQGLNQAGCCCPQARSPL